MTKSVIKLEISRGGLFWIIREGPTWNHMYPYKGGIGFGDWDKEEEAEIE